MIYHLCLPLLVTAIQLNQRFLTTAKKQLIFKKKIGDEYLAATIFQTAKRLIAQSLYITKKNRQGPSRVMPLLYPTFTSETRAGDTDSSANNVNENGTVVNTDAGEKAYRKAEEAYQFNQQLPKRAPPQTKRQFKDGHRLRQCRGEPYREPS